MSHNVSGFFLSGQEDAKNVSLKTLKSFFFFFLQNLRGEIEKVVSFLGKSLTEEQLTRLTQHLRVDQFAKNDAVNYEICKELGFMNNSGNFIRKGITSNFLNLIF